MGCGSSVDLHAPTNTATPQGGGDNVPQPAGIDRVQTVTAKPDEKVVRVEGSGLRSEGKGDVPATTAAATKDKDNKATDKKLPADTGSLFLTHQPNGHYLLHTELGTIDCNSPLLKSLSTKLLFTASESLQATPPGKVLYTVLSEIYKLYDAHHTKTQWLSDFMLYLSAIESECVRSMKGRSNKKKGKEEEKEKTSSATATATTQATTSTATSVSSPSTTSTSFLLLLQNYLTTSVKPTLITIISRSPYLSFLLSQSDQNDLEQMKLKIDELKQDCRSEVLVNMQEDQLEMREDMEQVLEELKQAREEVKKQRDAIAITTAAATTTSQHTDTDMISRYAQLKQSRELPTLLHPFDFRSHVQKNAGGYQKERQELVREFEKWILLGDGGWQGRADDEMMQEDGGGFSADFSAPSDSAVSNKDSSSSSSSSSRLFLLTSQPQQGKTTFISHLIQQYATCVYAVHFCEKDAEERVEGETTGSQPSPSPPSSTSQQPDTILRILHSLFYQLLSRLPVLKDWFLLKLKEDNNALKSALPTMSPMRFYQEILIEGLEYLMWHAGEMQKSSASQSSYLSEDQVRRSVIGVLPQCVCEEVKVGNRVQQKKEAKVDEKETKDKPSDPQQQQQRKIPPCKMLIVIDALDELDDLVVPTSDSATSIDSPLTLLTLLTSPSLLNKLPSWIGIVVTTNEKTEITKKFDQMTKEGVCKKFELGDVSKEEKESEVTKENEKKEAAVTTTTSHDTSTTVTSPPLPSLTQDEQIALGLAALKQRDADDLAKVNHLLSVIPSFSSSSNIAAEQTGVGAKPIHTWNDLNQRIDILPETLEVWVEQLMKNVKELSPVYNRKSTSDATVKPAATDKTDSIKKVEEHKEEAPSLDTKTVATHTIATITAVGAQQDVKSPTPSTQQQPSSNWTLLLHLLQLLAASGDAGMTIQKMVTESNVSPKMLKQLLGPVRAILELREKTDVAGGTNTTSATVTVTATVASVATTATPSPATTTAAASAAATPPSSTVAMTLESAFFSPSSYTVHLFHACLEVWLKKEGLSESQVGNVEKALDYGLEKVKPIAEAELTKLVT